MDLTNQIILLAGMLVMLSVIAGAISPRIGMPLLLVFLVIGMLAGEDGPGGLAFDDVGLAYLAGSLALAVILFDGGLRTDMRLFRVGLRPALSLASAGVVLTASATAAFCMWILELRWMEALLLGAIVSSTDAAAVFALLTRRQGALNERVAATLEIESGTNDPMAIFLTATLVGLIAAGTGPTLGVAWNFVWQMGIGTAAGLAGGVVLAFLVNRLTLSAGLYPLLALSGCAVVFGATQMLGASGFLAAYIAGLVLGNRRIQALHNIQRFFDGVAWLAQIGLFLILGLLVTPHELGAVAVPALAIAAFLIFVARPAAVWLSLLPFRFRKRERTFIAWVGLRGAVPIVLAMFPLLGGIENAELYFNVAFFIVLVSLVLQGWTIAPAAKLLRVEVPTGSSRIQRIELELPGQVDYEVVGYRVAADSPALGKSTDDILVGLDARTTLIVRDGKLLEPEDAEILRRNDYIYLVVRQDVVAELDPVFVGGRMPDHLKARSFFGDFMLDPDTTLGDLAEIYGFDIAESERTMTINAYIIGRFPTPVVGDRIGIGNAELVIREMLDDRITRVGLKLADGNRRGK